MSISSRSAPRPRGSLPLFVVALACLLSATVLPSAGPGSVAADIGHLVVSEVVTGGASANDELIELYNPSLIPLPLEGLELVYASSTGVTVTRRAAWDVGAAAIPPGGHLLVANQIGAFAPIADALYASAIAATGGSVALRIQGAAGPIDAVGWGSASGAWIEGAAASAPSAGSSIERLPGGSAGSTVDTDDNAADFAVRPVPDPQNVGSAPVPDPTAPSPTPGVDPSSDPSVPATASPTPAATSTPAPTPSEPPIVPIATARALPEGMTVTVEGVALTAADFTDGGGYIADGSGGIAILPVDGGFARGERVVVNGTIDDRFSQRTIRAAPGGIVPRGSGDEPGPITMSTAGVAESVEGRLIRVEGTLSNASPLTGGFAFDLDDGSGAVRLVIASSTGIDTAVLTTGSRVGVVGVVGQRDSSGSGVTGYRVQPRDSADLITLPGASPSPTPSSSSSSGPNPSASPAGEGPISIAEARAAARNERVRVRGTVTLASGVIDASTAVIQDPSGAILLRLGSEAGRLNRGRLVEVEGVRSTKGGMESLRVSVRPRQIGAGVAPHPRALRTGDASEAVEAQLVVVRGALVASARRASSKAVSFEIDDGSGPLRIAAAATLRLEAARLKAGSWVEVRGVLGQQTSGAEPTSGYRVWPRVPADVRVVAAANPASGAVDSSSPAGGAAAGSGTLAALDALGSSGDPDLRVGATLVIAPWPEQGVAGLLWDGERVVAVAPSSADELAASVGTRVAPVTLELAGLREVGVHPRLGTAIVELGGAADQTLVVAGRSVPPTAQMPARGEPARWVALVGRISPGDARRSLELADGSLRVDIACGGGHRVPDGVVGVVGVAIGGEERIVVPCGGISAAPGLSLSLLAAAAPLGDEATAGPGGSATDGGEALRAPAATLLLAATVLLGAGLAARGAWGRRPTLESDHERSAGSEDDDQSTVPELTLVAVPRERGP